MYSINDNRYAISSNLEEITFVDYSMRPNDPSQKSNIYKNIIDVAHGYLLKSHLLNNRFSFPGFIKDNSTLFVVLGVFGAISLYLSSFIKSNTTSYFMTGNITGNTSGTIYASIITNSSQASIFNETNSLFAQNELILTLGSLLSLFIFILIGFTIIYECLTYRNEKVDIVNRGRIIRFQKTNSDGNSTFVKTIKLISNILAQFLFLLAFMYILAFVSMYVILNPITEPFVFILGIIIGAMIPIMAFVFTIIALTKIASSYKDNNTLLLSSTALLFLYVLFFIFSKYVIKLSDTNILVMYAAFLILTVAYIYDRLSKSKNKVK